MADYFLSKIISNTLSNSTNSSTGDHAAAAPKSTNPGAHEATSRCAIIYAVRGLEAPMARVMIACPDTGRSIYTGVSYDELTFGISQLADKPVFCPECGQVHTWNKQDAYLESEEDAHQP